MSSDEVKKRIFEVLEKGYLMSLGTCDDGGVWVADVTYIHDKELNIYWKSFPTVRHSRALLQNNKVAGTITINGPTEDDFGIQLEGIAQKIEEERYDLSVEYFSKKNREKPPPTEDTLHGRSWYILKPHIIQLIDKKNLGIEKATLELNN